MVCKGARQFRRLVQGKGEKKRKKLAYGLSKQPCGTQDAGHLGGTVGPGCGGGVGAAALAVIVILQVDKMGNAELDFRSNRILAWLNPEDYATGTGFQTLQSLYAIGSGGIFGKGLGQSIQKLGFLPEAQNDMIFSIICEELGLFGGIAVILLFVILCWRFMVIANNAPDLFGALLVVGVMGHIAIQVILNIAVVTNTIPNTGISLPFISYGGSSVMFLLIEIGMVLSVARGIRLKTV